MRKFNKLMALVLTLALCLSMAITASAVETTTADGQDVYITKELTVAAGTSADAMTFEFDFARAEGSVGLQENEAQTYPVPGKVEITTPAVAAGTANQTVKAEGQVIMPEYDHAGFYKYTVTETTGTKTGVEYNVANATYTMTVCVANNGDNLIIKDIIVAKAEKLENTGSTTTNGSVTGNDFVFQNTYIKTISGETAALTVTNEVAGDYADKTKPFSYEVTITKNSLDPAKAVSFSVAANPVTLPYDSNGQVTYKFELKHGESFLIPEMVAGATYEVSQTDDPNYTKTVVGDESGVIVEDGVTVAYTNTYGEVTPTGIAMNNAPFMMMIGAAGLFLLLMLVSKKRREEA